VITKKKKKKKKKKEGALSWTRLRQTTMAEQSRSYSGNDIFCKLVKKSLLRVVEAESILRERLVAMCVTCSGSTIPSRSTCSSGLKALIPFASNSESFLKVQITG
jgi:hypothetical protein